ncbi:hypothetical protein T4A_2366 [Trichinella pseudospiralis]|uniref:Uncharacterized protein n=1 Tax=Trichinella pseudospiralis TaxID=6337 RepID=A0A0V1DUC8_TRIPS|nr:hypothetical protein T4A_2366 [Trichinella pseudospiralis]
MISTCRCALECAGIINSTGFRRARSTSCRCYITFAYCRVHHVSSQNGNYNSIIRKRKGRRANSPKIGSSIFQLTE